MKVVNRFSESQIEQLILEYLNALSGIFAWKNITAGYFDPVRKIYRKQSSKFAINGTPDVMGFYKLKTLFIEVKTPKELKYLLNNYEMLRTYFGPDKKKTHLREQIEFIERAKKHGQLAFFADSIECVRKHITEFEANEH